MIEISPWFHFLQLSLFSNFDVAMMIIVGQTLRYENGLSHAVFTRNMHHGTYVRVEQNWPTNGHVLNVEI